MILKGNLCIPYGGRYKICDHGSFESDHELKEFLAGCPKKICNDKILSYTLLFDKCTKGQVVSTVKLESCSGRNHGSKDDHNKGHQMSASHTVSDWIEQVHLPSQCDSPRKKDCDDSSSHNQGSDNGCKRSRSRSCSKSGSKDKDKDSSCSTASRDSEVEVVPDGNGKCRDHGPLHPLANALVAILKENVNAKMNRHRLSVIKRPPITVPEKAIKAVALVLALVPTLTLNAVPERIDKRIGVTIPLIVSVISARMETPEDTDRNLILAAIKTVSKPVSKAVTTRNATIRKGTIVALALALVLVLALDLVVKLRKIAIMEALMQIFLRDKISVTPSIFRLPLLNLRNVFVSLNRASQAPEARRKRCIR